MINNRHLSNWFSENLPKAPAKVSGFTLLVIALTSALPGKAHAGTMLQMPVEISTSAVGKGAVPVALLLSVFQSDDNLRFDTTTKDGADADITGLFFNVQNDDQGFLDGLSILQSNPSGARGTFSKDAVDNLGNGVNLKGSHMTWDAGIKFDKGFSETSFLLSHPDGLKLENFFGSFQGKQGEELAVFGARVQSIGNSKEGAKLVGYSSYDSPGLLPSLASMNSTETPASTLAAATAHPAPEPTSLAVWALATAGLGAFQMRRRRRQQNFALAAH